MSTLMKWFDREFEHRLPVGLHPNVRARLRGTPARLEELVAGLPGETLIAHVDGTWSIQQNVGHLGDIEDLWARRNADFDAGAEVLAPADLENRRTHAADHDSASLDDLLARFRSARTAMVRAVDGLPDDAYARRSRHPRLDQPMRFLDHLLFVAEHDDHHLARIDELLGRLEH